MASFRLFAGAILAIQTIAIDFGAQEGNLGSLHEYHNDAMDFLRDNGATRELAREKMNKRGQAFHHDFGKPGCYSDIKPRESDATRIRFRQEYPADYTTLSPLAKTQLAHVKNGTGVIVNIHVTHHAGTTLCTAAKLGQACCNCTDPCEVEPDWSLQKLVRSAKRHCKSITGTDRQKYLACGSAIFERYFFESVAAFSPENHYWSLEFMSGPDSFFWEAFPFKSEKVLSVFIARDPMQRLLSGDGQLNLKYPEAYPDSKLKPRNFHRFAVETPPQASDYAMNILSGKIGNVEDGDRKVAFEMAKKSIDQFSIILDQACFGRSICAFCSLLGWDNCHRYHNLWYPHDPHEAACPEKLWVSTQHVIQPREDWELLLSENTLGIEVYKRAKERALKKCPCFCKEVDGIPKCNCGPWSPDGLFSRDAPYLLQTIYRAPTFKS